MSNLWKCTSDRVGFRQKNSKTKTKNVTFEHSGWLTIGLIRFRAVWNPKELSLQQFRIEFRIIIYCYPTHFLPQIFNVNTIYGQLCRDVTKDSFIITKIRMNCNKYTLYWVCIKCTVYLCFLIVFLYFLGMVFFFCIIITSNRNLSSKFLRSQKKFASFLNPWYAGYFNCRNVCKALVMLIGFHFSMCYCYSVVNCAKRKGQLILVVVKNDCTKRLMCEQIARRCVKRICCDDVGRSSERELVSKRYLRKITSSHECFSSFAAASAAVIPFARCI